MTPVEQPTVVGPPERARTARPATTARKKTQIVVVGGGAGGLELAARLGRRFGRKDYDIILLEKNRTHIWKPVLHEVAAGARSWPACDRARSLNSFEENERPPPRMSASSRDDFERQTDGWRTWAA